jgi:hypothetical protein
MVAFIDAHREVHGVESICTLLPIAPSTYFRHKAQHADPDRRSARARRDDELRVIILRIWNENRQVYGPRKVWKQMGREGLREARRCVRQRPRRDGDWPLQDGGHSSLRFVAQSRGRRIRDARVGRLVQPSAVARTDRVRAAGGI